MAFYFATFQNSQHLFVGGMMGIAPSLFIETSLEFKPVFDKTGFFNSALIYLITDNLGFVSKVVFLTDF
jgi:hypothetical protein